MSFDFEVFDCKFSLDFFISEKIENPLTETMLRLITVFFSNKCKVFAKKYIFLRNLKNLLKTYSVLFLLRNIFDSKKYLHDIHIKNIFPLLYKNETQY